MYIIVSIELLNYSFINHILLKMLYRVTQILFTYRLMRIFSIFIAEATNVQTGKFLIFNRPTPKFR